MKNIFQLIKKVQATPKTELNHTLKDLLVAILIRCGNRGHIGFDNSEIGSWIDEDSEYIKNLLSKLKCKKYLEIKGRKSQRKIYPGEKLVRDCESRTDDIKKVRDSQSPNVTASHEPKNLPYIEKEKKEKLLPINFQLQSLRFKLPKNIRNKPRITYILKDGLDRIGFDRLADLLFDMKMQSHADTDFVGVLVENFNSIPVT